MYIAFEGPDKTGKSTSAANLSHDKTPIYNATKEKHRIIGRVMHKVPELVVAYDRIDWLTHMVYRLALPDHDWHDDRPRTVFAMPDTHLVFKIHSPALVRGIEDELYKTGTLATVNEMYYDQARFLIGLNRKRNYALFKSISIMEVYNDPSNDIFGATLIEHSSHATEGGYVCSHPVYTDEELLEVLRDEDR